MAPRLCGLTFVPSLPFQPGYSLWVSTPALGQLLLHSRELCPRGPWLWKMDCPSLYHRRGQTFALLLAPCHMISGSFPPVLCS